MPICTTAIKRTANDLFAAGADHKVRRMVRKISISDVLELTPAERILLVEDIWDSIAEVPEAVPLTDAQREDLDARLEACRADPSAGSTWAEVKARVFRKP